MGYRLPPNARPPFNPWAQSPMQVQPILPNTPAMPAPQMAPIPPALSPAALGVTPVAAHSGLKESAKQGTSENETAKNESSSRENTYLGPEEMLANYNAAASLPAIDALRRSQEQNRALFEMNLHQPKTVDWANPLSVAAHNLDPHNTVIAPTKMNMDEKEVREWAKQQQDDQRDLAHTIIQGMNAERSGYNNDQIATILGLKKFSDLQASAQDPTLSGPRPNNFVVTNFDKWTMRADQRMKPDLEAAREAEHLRQAINGSPIAQREIPIILTRMLTGGSRQPVQEVAMAKDPGLWQGLEQKWKSSFHDSSDPSTWDSLTPDIKREYTHFAKELLKVHDQGLQIRRQQSLNDARDYQIPQDRAEAHLKDYYISPYTPQAGQKAGLTHAAPQKPKVDINALIMKELEKGAH